jgi:hypothetical protein
MIRQKCGHESSWYSYGNYISCSKITRSLIRYSTEDESMDKDLSYYREIDSAARERSRRRLHRP